jgi:hypothetical protein
MIDCLALSTLTRYPSLFIWDQGIVSSTYFNENDNAAAINLKKGIMSLFQYKQDNASETDTLGKCDTEYRTHEHSLIKDKSKCTNIRYNDEYSSSKQVRNNEKNFIKFAFIFNRLLIIQLIFNQHVFIISIIHQLKQLLVLIWLFRD